MSPESTPSVLSQSSQSMDEKNSEAWRSEPFELDLEDAIAPPAPQSPVEDSDPIVSPPAPPPTNVPWLRILWALFGLAGLGAIGWFIYSKFLMPGAPPQGPGFGPMPVSVAQPKLANIRETADYIATLESRESVTVQPQAAGRISQIFVQAGDRIKAGSPLLRLDADIQEAQVVGSQAAIDAASADIVAAQADLESARQTLEAFRSSLTSRQSDLKFKQQEYNRFKTLQDKGAASVQILQEKQTALEQAKSALAEMQAQIKTQEAVIARAQADVVRQRQQKDVAIAAANQDRVQLRYYTVTAPIDGIVGDIPAKVGDLVNQSSSLLTLTQNQSLDVNIEVPQEKVNQLRVGMPVQLLANSETVLKTGSISSIAPEVSAQTQSVQVKARFGNSSEQLRTNQMMKARIIWANRSGVLVPMTAISRLAGKNFVFVIQRYGESSCGSQSANPNQPVPAPDQWVAVQKPVELGPIIENSQAVSQGVGVGDRLITSGLLQLQNCMPIQPNP